MRMFEKLKECLSFRLQTVLVPNLLLTAAPAVFADDCMIIDKKTSIKK